MSYEPDAPSGGSASEKIREARAREAAADLKSRASGIRDEAADAMDQARAAAAGGLDSAANALHRGAEAGESRVRGAANKAAGALATSADYVREHDVGDMVDDLMVVVRNNPGPALLGAAALGFLLGRAFSRD